jgi:hypothetical protein
VQGRTDALRARRQLRHQRPREILPAPRLHLIRYHGVLAPNARLRARVVQRLRHRPAALPELRRRGLKIIAAILQWAAIGKILTHLRLDPRPPPRGRASEAGHAFAAD